VSRKAPKLLHGLDMEAMERAGRAARLQKIKDYEKPSDRLNRTGERLPDPNDFEIELYRIAGEKARRDLLLLPMLLHFALENAMTTEGLEFDETIFDSLLNSAKLVVRAWPKIEQAKVASLVASDALHLLNNCGAAHSRHAILAAAYLIQQAVDDGAHAAPDSMAVLTAMAIQAEAQEEGKGGSWDFRPDVLPDLADRIAENARIRGYL